MADRSRSSYTGTSAFLDAVQQLDKGRADPEAAVIKALRDGPARVSALATSTSLPLGRIDSALEKLQRLGIVVVEKSPDGAMVDLTADGKALARQTVEWG